MTTLPLTRSPTIFNLETYREDKKENDPDQFKIPLFRWYNQTSDLAIPDVWLRIKTKDRNNYPHGEIIWENKDEIMLYFNLRCRDEIQKNVEQNTIKEFCSLSFEKTSLYFGDVNEDNCREVDDDIQVKTPEELIHEIMTCSKI